MLTAITKSALIIAIIGCVVSPAVILTTDVWWREGIALVWLFINLSLVSAVLTTVLFHGDLTQDPPTTLTIRFPEDLAGDA